MARPLPAFHRPDIPAPVERVLHKAMSPAPEDRYFSALEFARAMQRVQLQMYGHAERTTIEGEADIPTDLAAHEHQTTTATPTTTESSRRGTSRTKPLAIALVALAAIVAIASGFLFLIAPHMDTTSDDRAAQVSGSGPGGKTSGRNNGNVPDSGVVAGSVPQVRGLSGAYNAAGTKATFSWTNPDPQDGDVYAWTIVGGTDESASSQTALTSSTSIDIAPSGEAHTCIQVSLIRTDRRMSDTPAMACAIRP